MSTSHNIPPIAGLDVWPEHRREGLLWRLALDLDYDGVDDYVRANVGGTCLDPGWRPPAGQLTAVLGDDGRHHLFRDDLALCTEIDYGAEIHAAMGGRRRGASRLDDSEREILGKQLLAQASRLQQRFATEDRDRHGGRIPHDRVCSWWTDGATYGMSAPKTAPENQRRRPLAEQRVSWSVGLIGDPADPRTVAPSRRCTFIGGRSVWPPYSGDDRLSRIRRRLIDRAGPLCHACQRTSGVVADHSHFTGLCRGLLCWSCNMEIDTCPHLDGCPRAVYLNNPPALELRLRHPNAAKDRQHDHARIEYLGIDPIAPVRAWVRKI